MNLKDKIVTIAGGADGIGLDITKKFIKSGAKAVILDIDIKRGMEVVEYFNRNFGKGKVEFIECDVSKHLEVIYKKIMEKYETIDILVNCVVLFDEDNPKLMIDISLTALIEWSRKFYDHMRKDKGGKGGAIINISSIYGYRPIFSIPIYHAVKHAIVGYTRSLGHVDNFNITGVRVIAICPGVTETKLLAKVMAEAEPRRLEIIKKIESQPVDAVGDAAVDIFEKANSGSVWLVEGGRVVEDQLKNLSSTSL